MLCHDPRISNDRSQKIETKNPALILAEQYRGSDERPVDWEVVAQQADECDELVDITTWRPVYPDLDGIMLRRKKP
jgi:hypothetical protein